MWQTLGRSFAPTPVPRFVPSSYDADDPQRTRFRPSARELSRVRLGTPSAVPGVCAMRADRHAFTRALPSVRPTRPPNQASPPPAGPPLAFRPGRDGTAGNRTVTTREARESHRRAMSLGARVTNLRPSRSQRENRAALCAIPRTGRGRTLVNHSACGQRNRSGGGLSGLGMDSALGNLQLR